MKNLIIICLLMMFGFLRISIAQDAVQEVPVLTTDQQQAVDEAISMDPRLSAEEIEQLKIAVLGAPAKAEEAIDPKLESQPVVVTAPWNAEPIEEREEAIPHQVTQTSMTQTGTQPEAGKSENVTNYRSLNGPASQPQSAKSEKVVNYRSIKGPNSQPLPKPDGN